MTSRLPVPPKTRVASSSQVTEYMRSMSAFSVSRIWGRWTLTATSSPLRSVARCTWPIDAAANDARSNDANTTSGSPPSSLLMIARTSSYGNGATWLRSPNSSSQYATGNRS